MERWIGKVAVVTGASGGIGAAVAIDLVKAGLIVVGLARRVEKIQDLKKQLVGAAGKLHAYECDVSNEQSIKKAFQWIEINFGGVNILVNNAGISIYTSILEDDSIQQLKKVIDTNLTGMIICTKSAFDILQKTKDIGHVVNICSVLAYSVPFSIGNQLKLNVYPGTKHAIRATTEILRQELIHLNKKVKISLISPGFVRTDIVHNANVPNPDEYCNSINMLNAQDVSDAVLYVIGTPPHVQVHDLLIKPVGEQF